MKMLERLSKERSLRSQKKKPQKLWKLSMERNKIRKPPLMSQLLQKLKNRACKKIKIVHLIVLLILKKKKKTTHFTTSMLWEEPSQ